MPLKLKIKSPYIKYYGELRDAEQIKKIIQEHDVLVCPSWSEGFPNVILEAMANGLGIIVTNVGAVSSLVNNENGLLISANDKTSLQSSIKEAINLNQSELDKKKLNSLQKISTQFNWDVIIKILIDKIKYINKVHI